MILILRVRNFPYSEAKLESNHGFTSSHSGPAADHSMTRTVIPSSSKAHSILTWVCVAHRHTPHTTNVPASRRIPVCRCHPEGNTTTQLYANRQSPRTAVIGGRLSVCDYVSGRTPRPLSKHIGWLQRHFFWRQKRF